MWVGGLDEIHREKMLIKMLPKSVRRWAASVMMARLWAAYPPTGEGMTLHMNNCLIVANISVTLALVSISVSCGNDKQRSNKRSKLRCKNIRVQLPNFLQQS